MTRPLYADVQDVKDYATSISSSSTLLDTLIGELLVTESAFIDNYLNVPIAQATYTETYDGEGGQMIAPRQYPITALASVSIDNIAQAMWSPAMPFAVGFTFNRRFIIARNTRFPQGYQNIAITYTAGYAVIPDDIRQACIELVAFRIEERKRLGVSSKTLNGETIAFSTTLQEPPSVVARLDSYKSYVLTGGA